jgi:hypothetical protein
MLIEMLENSGSEVVSANTDGVVFKYTPVSDDVIAVWEYMTGFKTEETKYTALYSRDVNNYMAIKESRGIKCKGAYATGGLAKNPTNTICVEAIQSFLIWGIPIWHWIQSCNDITKFITCRKVKGGAIWDLAYLGANIRWYYGKGQTGYIQYASNGNKVPKSEGAVPLMDLPDKLPDDIDYDWYINEAYKILEDIDYVR